MRHIGYSVRPLDILDIEHLDIHVILSYFDDVVGPSAGLIVPPPKGRLEEDKLSSIPRLMDMLGTKPLEPFMHAVNEYGSVNVLFSVPMGVRGGYRDHMLSIVISPAEVREIVKINKMSGVIRSTAQLIKEHLRINPHEIISTKSRFVSSENSEIMSDLLSETRQFLRT